MNRDGDIRRMVDWMMTQDTSADASARMSRGTGTRFHVGGGDEIRRIPWPLWALGIGSLVVITIVLVAGLRLEWWTSRWTPERIAESCRRGDIVASALEAHFGARGTYPETLVALVPEYLDSIPAPVAGSVRWDYSGGEIRGKHVYTLRFTARNGRPYRYRNAGSEAWRESNVSGDGSPGYGER